MEKVILEARINEYNMRHGNPHVPWTIKEIVEEACKVREAGASILHFHARTPEGGAANDPQIYREIIRRIREKTDILLLPTLGFNSNDKDWDRIRIIKALAESEDTKPDLVPLDMGSVNLEQYDAKSGSFLDKDAVYSNPTDVLGYCAAEMKKLHIKVKMTCWDMGFVRRGCKFLETGRIEGPGYFLFHLTEGPFLTGHPLSRAGIDALRAVLPEEKCYWSVNCKGGDTAKEQAPTEEVQESQETEEEPEKASAAEDKAVTLKVGGIQTTEDPSTKALYQMAERANELSGGSLTLEVYPASQLGSATNEIEAVSMGSQDMFVDAGWMGTFLKDKAIDGMWFTFVDGAHYDAYINSDLNQEMEEEFCTLKGVRILASNWYRAPRSFVTKTEIASAEDFAGMKIRVPDLPGSLESVDALEGKATQVAWSETYLALQQGVVDAAEGPLDNLYSMNFYEAAPYVTITEHNRDSMQVMINDRIFEGLSENQQNALVQAAKEAGDWYSEQIEATCQEAVDAMKENGATITELSEEQVAAMREKIQARTRELDAAGTYWKTGLYEQIEALTQ